MTRLHFPALTPVLAFILVIFMAGAGEAREIGLHVEPPLRELGVQASVGAILDKKDGVVEAVVFVTYEKAFRGKLYVSGFRADNTEIARSAFVFVDESAEAGGHVVFSFDAHTKLEEAVSFVLYGNYIPAPVEESAGEKAKKIVKELFQ